MRDLEAVGRGVASGNQGQLVPTRLLTGSYHGAAWLTGAKLGIEASWLVFPVIAALFLGYHFATLKPGTPDAPVGYNPLNRFSDH